MINLEESFLIIRQENTNMSLEILRLKDENRKMREALEFYSDPLHWSYDKIIFDVYHEKSGGKLARKVLKELGE